MKKHTGSTSSTTLGITIALVLFLTGATRAQSSKLEATQAHTRDAQTISQNRKLAETISNINAQAHKIKSQIGKMKVLVRNEKQSLAELEAWRVNKTAATEKLKKQIYLLRNHLESGKPELLLTVEGKTKKFSNERVQEDLIQRLSRYKTLLKLLEKTHSQIAQLRESLVKATTLLEQLQAQHVELEKRKAAIDRIVAQRKHEERAVKAALSDPKLLKKVNGIEFNSFESYRDLGEFEKEVVRDSVKVLLAAEPLWKRLDFDIDNIKDAETAAQAIQNFSDGLEKWKPLFTYLDRKHQGAVEIGSKLDLLIQEICFQNMSNPEALQVRFRAAISRFPNSNVVREALARLAEVSK